MPMYEFTCKNCKAEVTLVLTMKEREAGAAACPKCGGTTLETRLSTFHAKTSRKG